MKLHEALRSATMLYADGLNEIHSAGMCYALDCVWPERDFAYDFMEHVVKPHIHQYSPEPIRDLRMCWWATVGEDDFDPQIRVDCLNTLAAYAEYLDI